MQVVLGLLRYLVALALLYKLKGANAGNRTTPNSHASLLSEEDCAAYDLNGKIYSLAALKRNDGQPRFWAVSGQWNYTYNPCKPFSQGTTQTSNCFGDVAVCMGTVNKARYQLIGTQSSFHYDFNKKTRTPQLVYTNTKSYPNRKVIVDLKCDPSKKTPEEAVFEFISDAKGIWRFLVTSICSCPNGCPSDPDDPASHSGDGVYKLEYILPISALAVIITFVPLALYRQRILLCNTKGREDEDGDEREPVIRGNDVQDYGVRPENSQNAPSPSSAGPSSGSNNPKDNINIDLKRARNRHEEILSSLA